MVCSFREAVLREYDKQAADLRKDVERHLDRKDVTETTPEVVYCITIWPEYVVKAWCKA